MTCWARFALFLLLLVVSLIPLHAFTCPSPLTCQQPTDNETRLVLEELYHATGGPMWTRKCGDACWLDPNTSHCQWFGICCRATLSIALQGNNLNGYIPDSLSRLCQLSIMDLSNNSLYGRLPPFGSEMAFTNLLGLSLNSNHFSGPIPEYYGTLVSLQGLFLSHNVLSGGIPQSLGCLRNLVVLDLSFNLLSGPLPPIFSNSSIMILDLTANQFNGTLPTEWTSQVDSLDLLLGHNNFTGRLPENLLKLEPLAKLVLSHNQLSGPIPVDITQMPKLQILLLNDNHLTGPFPSTEVPRKVRSALVLIDVSNNAGITGTISDDFILQVPALTFLSVKGNKLMRWDSHSKLGWLELNYQNLGRRDGRIFFCPTPVTKPPYYFRVSVSPEFYGYNFCVCSTGYYGSAPHNCTLCPPNSHCADGFNLSWSRGYYPIFADHLTITGAMPCADFEGDGKRSVCNPYNNCSLAYGASWNNSCPLCATGSNGRLCSRCLCPLDDRCYFHSGGQCFECAETYTIVITIGVALALLSLIALVVCTHLFRRRSPTLARLRTAFREVSESGALKTLVVFGQTTAMLNDTWPFWINTSGMRYMDLFNASTDGTGIECVWHWMSSPVWNLASFFMIVPLATIAILVIVLVRVVYLRWRRSSGRPWGQGAYVWLWVVWWLVFELANRAFQVFECIPGEGEAHTSYMSSLPWLRCSTDTDWDLLRSLSIAAIVIYVTAIPLVFATLLFVSRKRLDTSGTRNTIGWLYACYRPGVRSWFELVVTLRRLLLALLPAIMIPSNPGRPGAVLAVLLCSLALQHWLQPMRRWVDNAAEEVALGCVLLTFSTQMLWKSFGQLDTLARMRSVVLTVGDLGSLLIIAKDYEAALMGITVAFNIVVLAALTGLVLWPLITALKVPNNRTKQEGLTSS